MIGARAAVLSVVVGGLLPVVDASAVVVLLINDASSTDDCN